MFVAYDIKNGVAYAKRCESLWVNGKTVKKYVYLGRVLDKDLGVYENGKQGIFTYDPKTNIYGKAPEKYIVSSKEDTPKELILDFGDSFLIDNYIDRIGLREPINAIGYGNPDTLYSMIMFYTLNDKSNCLAERWWKGNYASILYPHANLSSQRISEFLEAIGDEVRIRQFFNEYIHLLKRTKVNTSSVAIDSTKLPNNIHFPLTAIVNHNGEICNQARLIYIVQQQTGIPIFLRYCPGNVIDATMLVLCLEELKYNGIDINHAILDAGYYTDNNLKLLFNRKISFITRMQSNRKEFKRLLKKHIDGLQHRNNFVRYNGRGLYIKQDICDLAGHKGIAYICQDRNTTFNMEAKIIKRTEKLSNLEAHDALMRNGIFILVSSRKLKITEILPIYYMRQQVEQTFDIVRNYVNTLPIRVHKEETFRGHLLLTFISAIIMKKLQDELKETNRNPISLLMDLNHHHCKVYGNKILIQEIFKDARECYDIMKLECPLYIPRSKLLEPG
jgi:hypothetical protein